MIAMKMADEYGIHLGKVNMCASELHLGALPAIDQKALATHFHELRGSIVFERRQSTSTTQYMYLKWFHFFYLFLTFESIYADTVLQIEAIRTQVVDMECILVQ